jgi:hypothetical protein
MLNVSMFPLSIPSGAVVIAQRLRVSRPAAASKLTQSAICPATSRPRARRALRLSLAPRDSSRSVRCGSARPTEMAGPSPNASPVRSASRDVTITAPVSSRSAA